MTGTVKMEAIKLASCYAVRPEGQLGTCGFFPVPWEIQYIVARSKAEALRKAHHYRSPK